MFLFANILFNIYCWLNIEFTAQSVCLKLPWHKCFLPKSHPSLFVHGNSRQPFSVTSGVILNDNITEKKHKVDLEKDTYLQCEEWSQKAEVTLLGLSWELELQAPQKFTLLFAWPRKHSKYWFRAEKKKKNYCFTFYFFNCLFCIGV